MENTNEDHIHKLISEVRRRAIKTRRFAKLSIFGIVAVVALMIYYFSASGTVSPMFRIRSFGPVELERPSKTLPQDSSLTKVIKEIEDQIELVRSELDARQSLQEDVLLSVSLTIIRIASVFLAIYLIQILVGFTRYQFRVADHLDATADAFEITGGDAETLGKVVSVLAPQHIEFGKMPKTPTEQSIELIRDLIKKVPSR